MATEKKMGRKKVPITSEKKKEINLPQVIYWIERQSTAEEIAGSCGVHIETLSTAIKKEFGLTFPELFKKHACIGRQSLRRYQFKLAEKNVAMAIWLGKNYLGQHDPDNQNKAPPNDEKLDSLISAIKKQGAAPSQAQDSPISK